MKLHRDLAVRQATAWFMLHRIREAFADVRMAFGGPAEVDEKYVGGLWKNMSTAKRAEQTSRGCGPSGKTAVVGMKGRQTGQVTARVIDTVDGETLNSFVSFVDEHTASTPGPARKSTPTASAPTGVGRTTRA